MWLEQLSILCEIVRQGSFTRAGEVMHLTQPAISAQVKALEYEFQVKIFERSSKGVRLTEAGNLIYDSAVAILHQYEETHQVIMDLQHLRRGRITIQTTPTAGIHLLPPLIAQFHQRYPYVEMNLSIEHFWQITHHLMESSIELGIFGDSGVVDTEHLEVFPFLEDTLIVITPPNFAWDAESLDPQLLPKYPYIAFGERSATRQMITTRLNEVGVNLSICMVMGHIETIKQMVTAGCGISIVPEQAVRREVKAGLLKSYTLSGLDIKRRYMLAWRKNMPKSIALKTFVEFVLNNAKDISVYKTFVSAAAGEIPFCDFEHAGTPA